MQKMCIEKRRNAIARNSGKAEKLGSLKFRKDKAPHAKAGDIRSRIDERDNSNKKLLLTSRKD
jgi:hypothetical protein